MPMIDQNKKTARRAPWLLLGSALALRLVLALVTEGYPYDMSCFVAWGEKLAAQRPANFYSEGYFADYPPGYLPVLGLVALLRGALSLSYESPLTYLLLALAPALCDAAAAWLVWRVAAHSMPRSPALLLTAFTAFNPLTLFDTGVWKQIDGAFALPLLLCFLLLEQRRYLPAAFLYGVALAIKPQALLFGPVLAACFLAAIVQQTDRFRALGRCFGGAALALLPPLAMGLPFFGIRDLIPSLLEKYSGTMSGYPYASINAFNWITAMGGNWQPLENEALFGVSWHTVGWFMILAVTGGLVFFAVRSVNNGSFSPLLLAAYYGLGVFTFGHCMHERYMLPGVLLVLLAAARWHDVRLYAAGFGLSLTGFLNLAAVYSLAGTEDEWLTSATSSSFAVLVGLGGTLRFLLLLFAVWDLALHGHALPLPARPLYREADAPAAQPAWRRGEVLALLALTTATAALSFACLGDTDAPQNPLDATDTVLSETVTAESSAVWLWAYPGVSFGGSLKVTDEQGQVLLTQELGYTTCFSWSESRLPVEAGQTLTITVENAQMFELSFRNGDGDAVPVTGGGALFDEQDAVPDTISQLNSMYFDEIYHARTAYEQLHGLRIYETTHPPLGKDLIMAGVALFGMTGFGWRFSGTLFGVLLVPLAWCFARRWRWTSCALYRAVSRPLIFTARFSSCWGPTSCCGTARACCRKALPVRCCPWPWAVWRSAWAAPPSGPACMPGPGWRCSTWACCTPAGGRAGRGSGRSSAPRPSAAWRSTSWRRCASTLRPISRTAGRTRPSAWRTGGSARSPCSSTIRGWKPPIRLRAAGTPGCWACARSGITRTPTWRTA